MMSFITFVSFCLFILDFSGSNSVHEVATLYHSARLRNVLDKIDYFSKLVRKTDDIQGPVEADPEYILVRLCCLHYVVYIFSNTKKSQTFIFMKSSFKNKFLDFKAKWVT